MEEKNICNMGNPIDVLLGDHHRQDCRERTLQRGA